MQRGNLVPHDIMIAIVSYLSLVVVMSLVCFAYYGWDKRQSKNGGRRVPERTLHIMEFLGGWPGAMLGQQVFRHKTAKLSFLIVFSLLVVLHVAIVGTAAYLYFR